MQTDKPHCDSCVTKATPPSWLATYYPLLLIIGLLAIVACRGAESIHDWMLHFMAGFFLVFGFSNCWICAALWMPMRRMTCWPPAGGDMVLPIRF